MQRVGIVAGQDLKHAFKRNMLPMTWTSGRMKEKAFLYHNMDILWVSGTFLVFGTNLRTFNFYDERSGQTELTSIYSLWLRHCIIVFANLYVATPIVGI